MNYSPRTGFRLTRREHPGNDPGYPENSSHYNRFQGPALLLAAAFAGLLTACASQPEPSPPPAPAPQQAEPVEKAPVKLAPRAPERYVVKKGDTLWDISTMFLEDPWLWPEIWYTNPQIRNPHLIYPGDIITIFWKDGRPQLAITREGETYMTTLPITQLGPQVRTSPLAQAIPTIPIDAIRPFLGNPRVIDEDEYEELPYLLRSRDGRLMSGAGQEVFVRGGADTPGMRFHIIRLGDEYEDPETGDTLGYEAMEIAQGVVRNGGDPATFLIQSSEREAMKGDRLIPVDDREFNTNFIPTEPKVDVDAQIIDVVDGVSQIGQFQMVTINRGANDGLEVGNVLAIYQRGEEIDDTVGGGVFSNNVTLPDQRAGTLLVFRTFDEVAYGLVMNATSEIHLLDMARNP